MGLKNAENTKLPYSNVPWSERPLLNKTRLQTRSLFIYARRKAKAWHSDSNEHVGNVNKSNSEATQQDPTTDIPDLQNIPPSYDALHASTMQDWQLHPPSMTTTASTMQDWQLAPAHAHDCIHNARPTTTSTIHDHDCIHKTTTASTLQDRQLPPAHAHEASGNVHHWNSTYSEHARRRQLQGNS